MNVMVRTALSGAIKSVIGASWWSKVKDAVSGMSSSEMTGEEKRANVFLALQEAGWGLASWLLNLAIEIAVALMFAASDKIADQSKKK
jgi:hypothetical protein